MHGRPVQVVAAGILVADHLCEPIPRLPDPGELVMADRLVLEIGGCASNVAVDLAKMEVDCAVAGCVANDVFGDYLCRTLEQRGVRTDGIEVIAEAATSQTLIINVHGQDRRFIHSLGANACFAPRHLNPVLHAGCRVLYVGGYLLLPGLLPRELGQVFCQARTAGITTVLDVAGPSDLNPPALVRQLNAVLPHTDVFLPNNHEAELITGFDEPFAQAEFFRAAGAGTVVITSGADGAVLVSPQARLRCGVFQVPYLDGTGSGDAFDAGFICGLLRGLDERGCMTLASALGASCVRAVGTTPGVFTRTECELFLKQASLRIEEC